MNVVVTVLLLTVVSVSLAEDGFRRSLRRHPYRNDGVCPRDLKTRLGRREHPIACTRRCSRSEKEGYHPIYGNVCRANVPPVIVPPTPPLRTLAPGCADKDCFQCIYGYVKMFYVSGAKCLQKCPAGYQAVDGTCEKSLPEAPETPPVPILQPGCADEDCLRCLDGYVRMIDMSRARCLKKCPRRWKLVDGTCEIVPENPPNCADADCNKCLDGFVKIIRSGRAQCRNECPDGYYLKNGLCQLCDIPGCKECRTGSGTCKSCMPDLLPYRAYENSGVVCLRFCPSNAEIKLVKGRLTCVRKAKKKCTIPFCLRCTPEMKCSSCVIPFVVSPKTGLCTVCLPGTIYDPIKKICLTNPDKVKTKPPTPPIIVPVTPPIPEP